MMPIEFENVKKCEADAKLIMDWRNNPTTLKMFYHSELKQWDTFYTEFCETYFVDEDLPPVFAIDQGQRVGFLRFNPYCEELLQGRGTDIDINIDPDQRGKGYGAAIIKAATQRQRHKGYDWIIAEIKQINDASVNAFQKAGYRHLDSFDKTIEDTGEVVAIHRYVFDQKACEERKWVFFDLDGTLADSLDVMFQVYCSFLQSFGVSGTQEEFQELNGPSLNEIILVLKERYQLAPTVEELTCMYKDQMQQVYATQVKPFDQVSETLQALVQRDYHLMLTTSAEENIATTFMKQNDLDRYFEDSLYGDHVAVSKPDAGFYRQALDKVDALPDQVVVVEDSLNGIRAAKGAGTFVVGLTKNVSEEEVREAGSDQTISEIQQVLTVIH